MKKLFSNVKKGLGFEAEPSIFEDAEKEYVEI